MNRRRWVAPSASEAPVRPSEARQGIERRTGRRSAPQLPLSDQHRAVLAELTGEPRQATALARRLGLSTTMVESALYVLQRRGLAQKAGLRKGWTTEAPSE